MTSPAKILLELLLLAAVIVLGWKWGTSRRRSFVLWFAGITLTLSVLFYYLAAWPLYSFFGQSQGSSAWALHLLVWFDIIEWVVSAYFLSIVAIEVLDQLQAGGFLLLDRLRPRRAIPLVGVQGGLTAAGHGVVCANVICSVLPNDWAKGKTRGNVADLG